MKFSDTIGDFSGELQAVSAKLHHEKYEKLAIILNGVGSIVRRLAFIEKATQRDEVTTWITNSDLLEVIFPQQEVTVLSPASYDIGKEYKRIDQRWNFDPAAVAGHLLLQYDSHSKVPLLIVSDIQPGFSDLPDAVCKDITEALKD